MSTEKEPITAQEAVKYLQSLAFKLSEDVDEVASLIDWLDEYAYCFDDVAFTLDELHRALRAAFAETDRLTETLQDYIKTRG